MNQLTRHNKSEIRSVNAGNETIKNQGVFTDEKDVACTSGTGHSGGAGRRRLLGVSAICRRQDHRPLQYRAGRPRRYRQHHQRHRHRRTGGTGQCRRAGDRQDRLFRHRCRRQERRLRLAGQGGRGAGQYRRRDLRCGGPFGEGGQTAGRSLDPERAGEHQAVQGQTEAGGKQLEARPAAFPAESDGGK